MAWLRSQCYASAYFQQSLFGFIPAQVAETKSLVHADYKAKVVWIVTEERITNMIALRNKKKDAFNQWVFSAKSEVEMFGLWNTQLMVTDNIRAWSTSAASTGLLLYHDIKPGNSAWSMLSVALWIWQCSSIKLCVFISHSTDNSLKLSNFDHVQSWVNRNI